MKKIFGLWMAALLVYSSAQASPGVVSPYIKIDQFGYFPKSKKLAIVVDPQIGYNAAESFNPGTGANQYQVRRWSDDAVVFTGTLVTWNGGATHTQSGDKGWWFDFTTVEAVGSYYIYDLTNNVGSYRFEIGSDVYSNVLKQAVRTFFYQRINYAKTTPYTNTKWADAACFGGPNQDKAARLLNNTNPKDLSGGWMDAGDYNKYVTYAFDAICDLLETYRLHPTLFGDDYAIPESGNGIPDILDEMQWEIDWLKRMQDATGTGGLLLKVGVTTFNIATPPSTDNNPRYYLGECTSSTISGAAVFALSSLAYRSAGKTVYADDLLTRAINAWNRAKTTTSNFTSFQTNCDDQTIKAGDADMRADQQIDVLVTAAVYLYEATRVSNPIVAAECKNIIDTKYTLTNPIANWWWGPDYGAIQAALLRYTTLSGATTAVVSTIQTRKSYEVQTLSVNNYNAKTDLYRSYMPDPQWNWGSNRTKGYAGIHNFDFADYSISTTYSSDLFKEIGESYLHYLHGANPIGKVMLSNMYAFGGDDCVNEIYHSWFRDGSVWDNALLSSAGPPPGYMTGGPNPGYARDGYGLTSLIPPYNQPLQKAYKDWNTSWNGSADEASWAVTEPSIHNQAVYIGLLARVMASHDGEVVLPLHFKSFTVQSASVGAQLSWVVDETVDLQHFIIERSFNGRSFSALSQVRPQPNQLIYTFVDRGVKAMATTVYYRIKAIYPTEEIVSAIQKITAPADTKITVSPNPATTAIWINGAVQEESVLVIEVVDASGIVLQKEQLLQAKGVFRKHLSLDKLPAGTYWVRLQAGETTKMQKVIKQ